MIFGNPATFAIEVGEFEKNLDIPQNYIRFRFIILDLYIGDWDYCLPITKPVRDMKDFLSYRRFRQNHNYAKLDAQSLFANIYEYFYGNNGNISLSSPNKRDIYMMCEVGGASVSDEFSIIVVDDVDSTSRILVKDFKKNVFIVDAMLATSDIEQAGSSFVDWGEKKIKSMKITIINS